jgi:hypothetical protein
MLLSHTLLRASKVYHNLWVAVNETTGVFARLYYIQSVHTHTQKPVIGRGAAALIVQALIVPAVCGSR